jgi:hypothetical protein
MRLLASLTLIVASTANLWAQGTKPDIYGKADKLKPATEEAKKNGAVGSLFIEAPKDAKYNYDKAMVRITAKSNIRKMNGKIEEEAKFEDIKKGGMVSVWFTGNVAQSYPVQVTALKILIFPTADEKK